MSFYEIENTNRSDSTLKINAAVMVLGNCVLVMAFLVGCLKQPLGEEQVRNIGSRAPIDVAKGNSLSILLPSGIDGSNASSGISDLVRSRGSVTEDAILKAGDLIKGSGDTVFYYGFDGKKYPFPNAATYKTWYRDFSDIRTMSDGVLSKIPLGVKNITYRPGTRLVKIATDSKVYVIEPGGVRRWLTTSAIAKGIYGEDWEKRIDVIPDVFFLDYIPGKDIGVIVLPSGSLVREGMSGDVYYISGSTKRKVASLAAMEANGFRLEFVFTVSGEVMQTLVLGESIVGGEKDLFRPVNSGG